MSFSSDAKREIAEKPCTRSCCAKSEWNAALLYGEGIAFRGKGRYGLSLVSPEKQVIRRFAEELRTYWKLEPEVRILENDGLSGLRYGLNIDEPDAGSLLRELQLTDASALFAVRKLPRQRTVSMQCCQRSFLKAAFLVCGTVTDPGGAYHLEFLAPSPETADFLCGILNGFGLSPRVVERKGRYVVYLKKGDEVADALTLLEATGAVLRLENVRIYKEIGNTINRQVNCDSYNLQRRQAAAERQLEDIRWLERELGLEKLPQTLRQAARLRLEHPDATLAELGDLMNPPLGKSGVNSRLRRLSEMAEKLRAGESLDGE